jgi:hypothetical protein
MTDKAALAEELIKRNARLVADRAPWDTLWQEIAEHVMPRSSNITSRSSTPSAGKEAMLFDNTAVQANQILANGQLSWMTPMESRWFSYDPPAHMKGVDAAEQWFRWCSEIAQTALAKSRFYEVIHELYLARGAFGTGAIFCEEGTKNPLHFQNLQLGEFVIAEDAEGNVDTIFREFNLTARQAVMKFGEDNVSQAIKTELNDHPDKEFRFLHAVYPRKDADLKRLGGENKPIASVYIETQSKHICRESGYDEQPFFCSRYLHWASSYIGPSVYGYSPAVIALPESRQLQFLEQQLDALAELTAFPRVLVPDTHEGEVDMRAMGVTYFNAANPNAAPREWATAGRYDVGIDRADRKRKAIEKAFHVDLFQMFAMLEPGKMTAREVSERSAEKLIQFSPTFGRMTTELFNPLLGRVFGVMARAGMFPPPPPELFELDPTGGVMLAEPQISYSSRIALAIKGLENTAFARSLELLAPIMQMRPDVADNYDWDKIARDSARNDGLPARWLMPEDLVKEMRAQRAQEMARQQEMQQAAAMAETAAKVGSVPQDSVVGQALQGAMG